MPSPFADVMGFAWLLGFSGLLVNRLS